MPPRLASCTGPSRHHDPPSKPCHQTCSEPPLPLLLFKSEPSPSTHIKHQEPMLFNVPLLSPIVAAGTVTSDSASCSPTASLALPSNHQSHHPVIPVFSPDCASSLQSQGHGLETRTKKRKRQRREEE
ncbi:hypothetical protein M0R45_025848 [Rubus argutus]|uniref:Uncharacterized protein n=1 Tax=Rubus argutus TaxID=59490 RepID=A0AAW1WZF0_RUBAR